MIDKTKFKLSMKRIITFIFILTMIQAKAQSSGGLEFNGSDNYVEVIDSPLETIGTGDFTLEAWIKGDELEQTAHPMILSNRNSTTQGVFLSFHTIWGGSQSKFLNLQLGGSNYGLINNGSYNGSLLDNECHHVAVTRNGSLLSFYADGVLFGTRSIPSSVSVSSNEPLWIGQDKVTNNTFNGVISQCRIWNVARTDTEIFDNKDISLQCDETGLIAYWEMNEGNGQIVMDKTNQFEGQLGSQNGIDDQDPSWSIESCVTQLSGSLEFNGSDNYVEVMNSPLETIGTGNFTLEAWVKGDELEQTAHPMIFSNRNSTTQGIILSFHTKWGGSQSKSLNLQIGGSNNFLIDNGSYNGSLLDNECHHVAVTRNGSILSFYADGVLFGTKSISSSVSVSSNESLWIGQDRVTNNTFNGIISQCRIWNVARTDTEIFGKKDIRLPCNEVGLIAYWEMNEGNDQIVMDKMNQFEGQLGSQNGIDNQDPLWSTEGCIGETINTCPSMLDISDIPISDGVYVAGVTISSSGKVSANSNVNFNAGESIILNAGFEVELSASFHGYIEGCFPISRLEGKQN